jgi:hypothetical protein
MDYQKQLSQLRDNLHREVVQESTCKIFQQLDTTDGVLLLLKPLVLHVEFYHPEWDDYSEEVRVTAVDCNTGDLIGETLNGNERNIRYIDLTAENLLELHRAVTTKQYKFTEYQLHNEY